MSNYEITKKNMAARFLEYDQKLMIEKFNLWYDEDYLYIDLVSRPHRVNRVTGSVEWSDDEFTHVFEADHEATMTIYDVLCSSADSPTLSGEFVMLQRLSSIQGSSSTLGSGLFDEMAGTLNDRETELAQACAALGGIGSEDIDSMADFEAIGNEVPNEGVGHNTNTHSTSDVGKAANSKFSLATSWASLKKLLDKGDVASVIPLFPFFPVILRFWNADEEFPASLQVLFDANALQFMHFETLWYAAFYLIGRLQAHIETSVSLPCISS